MRLLRHRTAWQNILDRPFPSSEQYGVENLVPESEDIRTPRQFGIKALETLRPIIDALAVAGGVAVSSPTAILTGGAGPAAVGGGFGLMTDMALQRAITGLGGEPRQNFI